MTTFHLTVVTPDGCAFDGQAERIVCRAIDGDLAILAKHGDYCTALGMGEAHIVDAEGQRRRAACMGGLLSVLDGEVRLVATTWEWAEEIDQARAEASKKRAEEILAQKNLAQAGLRAGSGAPQACSGANLYPLKQKEKEPLHKLCGGSFCVHDEIKNKISAEHAQSECGGHLNRKDVTSYLPSRSGCGCDGPASPPQRCSRRRWAQ